jgi:hypothetical protein
VTVGTGSFPQATIDFTTNASGWFATEKVWQKPAENGPDPASGDRFAAWKGQLRRQIEHANLSCDPHFVPKKFSTP